MNKKKNFPLTQEMTNTYNNAELNNLEEFLMRQEYYERFGTPGFA